MSQHQFKKISALCGSAIILSAALVAPTNADAPAAGGGGGGGDAVSQGYLRQIESHTNVTQGVIGKILDRVDQLPQLISKSIELAINLQAADTSTTTTNMQVEFAKTGNSIVQNASNQKNTFATMDTKMLGNDVSKQTIPFAPSLLYSSILGLPVNIPDKLGPLRDANGNDIPSPPLIDVNDAPGINFVKFASGYAIKHPTPLLTWAGKPKNIQRYNNFYTTVMPVTSYGAYVLSGLIDENKQQGLTEAQTNLVTQASSSDWIATISTEEIGKVLRQLLMFESQNYVLTTQLLRVQKQQLAAQVMTNAIIVATSQIDEKKLLEDAVSP